MYIEGTGFYTCKERHKTESLRNHAATAHRDRERLGDRINVGESSCNCGDGTSLDVYDDDFNKLVVLGKCLISLYLFK
jgi:hypothetical protein